MQVSLRSAPDGPESHGGSPALVSGTSLRCSCTYEGWGHGTYNSSPCVQESVDAYLISLKVPPRHASCPAVEPTG
ncbi:alpha/beta hydrolase [Streptomyces sp. NPDC002793]|uniref:alpha/beta hydrolase n=1 Tax=Streptomyces sp. NPDC002793 TaxID=3154432 RepID=UPI00331E936C